MKFTTEQLATLNAQGHQIEEFITKLQPSIIKEIVIPFGEMVRRGRFNEIRETEFKLCVRKDELYGMCGGLTLYFQIPEYLKGVTGNRPIYDDPCYGADFLYSLCLNWQQIKRTLCSTVNEQNLRNEAVFGNFQI